MRSPFPLALLMSSRAASSFSDLPSRGELPPESPFAPLVGLWKGKLHRGRRGRGLTFMLLQTLADDGAVIGRLVFPELGVDAAEVKLLESSMTTYVALVGPHRDTQTGAELTTVIDGRKSRNKIWGTYASRAADGQVRHAGRFVAVRCQTAGGWSVPSQGLRAS